MVLSLILLTPKKLGDYVMDSGYLHPHSWISERRMMIYLLKMVIFPLADC